MSRHPNGFELAVRIARPVSDVYNHLAKPANLLNLQPLLVKMTPVARSTVCGRRCLPTRPLRLSGSAA